MLQNGYWRSVAVQAVQKPENCHGAGFISRAGARVRVQVSAGFVLGPGVKAKSMTNNLPILSVLYVGLILKLSGCMKNSINQFAGMILMTLFSFLAL
jgi:hypothetical protein